MWHRWYRGSFAPDLARPWTTAGGPDPGYEDRVRETGRFQLTDSSLVEQFRALEPHAPINYGRAIRALELVWDCPHDKAVNVVGYLCAECRRSRE